MEGRDVQDEDSMCVGFFGGKANRGAVFTSVFWDDADGVCGYSDVGVRGVD